jgi:hypothetical protein
MIFAIVAAPAAMPVNPNTAAIIAMMRNVTVQRNISKCFIGETYLLPGVKSQKACQTTGSTGILVNNTSAFSAGRKY